MLELTCEKCPVENREGLTCQACKVSFELRKVLRESIPLREILKSKSRSLKYRDKKIVELHSQVLMNRELNIIKHIVTETEAFAKLESMNLGNYEIFIEAISDEKNQSWDVRVTLHLPKAIAEEKYCSIKI